MVVDALNSCPSRQIARPWGTETFIIISCLFLPPAGCPSPLKDGAQTPITFIFFGKHLPLQVFKNINTVSKTLEGERVSELRLRDVGEVASCP